MDGSRATIISVNRVLRFTSPWMRLTWPSRTTGRPSTRAVIVACVPSHGFKQSEFVRRELDRHFDTVKAVYPTIRLTRADPLTKRQRGFNDPACKGQTIARRVQG